MYVCACVHMTLPSLNGVGAQLRSLHNFNMSVGCHCARLTMMRLQLWLPPLPLLLLRYKCVRHWATSSTGSPGRYQQQRCRLIAADKRASAAPFAPSSVSQSVCPSVSVRLPGLMTRAAMTRMMIDGSVALTLTACGFWVLQQCPYTHSLSHTRTHMSTFVCASYSYSMLFNTLSPLAKKGIYVGFFC